MSGRSRLYFSLVLTVVALVVCGFSFQRTAHIDESILVTAAPVYEPLAALKGGERFPKGARLLLTREGSMEPLVPGFYATADADVSFDATHVLFAGRQVAGEPWQIWELSLADHSVRKVIAAKTDVIRPLYLPGSR